MNGQWVGYFTYRREYGVHLEGEKVFFRVFLEDRGITSFRERVMKKRALARARDYQSYLVS